jgi:hypothetical protein
VELLNWAYGGACPAEIKHLRGRIRTMSGAFGEKQAEEALA